MWIVDYWIKCDKCEAQMFGDGAPKSRAIASVRKAGWSVRGNYAVCPKCNGIESGVVPVKNSRRYKKPIPAPCPRCGKEVWLGITEGGLPGVGKGGYGVTCSCGLDESVDTPFFRRDSSIRLWNRLVKKGIIK